MYDRTINLTLILTKFLTKIFYFWKFNNSILSRGRLTSIKNFNLFLKTVLSTRLSFDGGIYLWFIFFVTRMIISLLINDTIISADLKLMTRAHREQSDKCGWSLKDVKWLAMFEFLPPYTSCIFWTWGSIELHGTLL